MHRISKLWIQRFRVCKDVKLTLSDFTPLVGQNNTGKSTILTAINWLVNPTGLEDSDPWNGAWPVSVIACIEGITDQILERVTAENQRAAISQFCQDGALWIKCEATGKRKPAVKYSVYAPPSSDNHSDDDDDEVDDWPSTADRWKANPAGIPEVMKGLFPPAVFIRATDSIGDDLAKTTGNSVLKQLLGTVMKPVLDENEKLRDAVKTICEILNPTAAKTEEQAAGSDNDGSAATNATSTDPITNFNKRATTALATYFPGLSLQLVPSEFAAEDLFKSGEIRVIEDGAAESRRFDTMGGGAQRSILMAFVQILAEQSRKSDDAPSRTLLLIDEPELFLHPRAVRQVREALRTLSQRGFQVVCSTHSPLMISREQAECTVRIRRDSSVGSLAVQTLMHAVRDLQLDEKTRTQMELVFRQDHLAEIYFADLVVICEGSTDVEILRKGWERLQPVHSGTAAVYFLGGGSCTSQWILRRILHALQIPCVAVSDLDFAFFGGRHHVPPGVFPSDDEMRQVKCVFSSIDSHRISLNGGLPCQRDGFIADDGWALFAKTPDALPLITSVIERFRSIEFWIWGSGAVERVIDPARKDEEVGGTAKTNSQDRGRELLSTLSNDDLRKQMPELAECMDWIQQRLDLALNTGQEEIPGAASASAAESAEVDAASPAAAMRPAAEAAEEAAGSVQKTARKAGGENSARARTARKKS